MTATITAHSPAVPMEAVTSTRPAARDLITLPVIGIYLWTFIHIGRPQDVFEVLKVIRPGNIAAGLTVLSFLLWGEKDKKVFAFPEAKLFLLFFVVALLSIPYSSHIASSINFTTEFFGKVGLYLYITSKLITSEKRIDGLIKTLVLSGFLMAMATVLSRIPGVRTAIGTAVMYDPNDMALLMVVAIPLALTQGLAATKRHWRLICYSCLAVCLFALIATVSRGGFLGLLAIGFFILKARMPGLSRSKIIFLCAVFGLFFIVSAGDEFSERMFTITEGVSSVQAGSGRILIWNRALLLVKDHPFFGVGLGAFTFAYGSYLAEGLFKGWLAPYPGEWAPGAWRTAHNAYLLALAELGIVGFIVYVLFIFKTFKNLNNLLSAHIGKTKKYDFSLIVSGIKISYIGFLVCAFFLSQTYSVIFFLYFFISGSLFRLQNRL